MIWKLIYQWRGHVFIYRSRNFRHLNDLLLQINTKNQFRVVGILIFGAYLQRNKYTSSCHVLCEYFCNSIFYNKVNLQSSGKIFNKKKKESPYQSIWWNAQSVHRFKGLITSFSTFSSYFTEFCVELVLIFGSWSVLSIVVVCLNNTRINLSQIEIIMSTKLNWNTERGLQQEILQRQWLMKWIYLQVHINVDLKWSIVDFQRPKRI